MATAGNDAFLATVRRLAPQQRHVSAFFAQAYASVQMIARGLAASGGEGAESVLAHAKAQSYEAPFGPLRIHAETNHAILSPQVAAARADGAFEVLERAATPIVPDPYLAHGETGNDRSSPAAHRPGAPHLRVVK
jgi:branched-chain amino acid transport system substrate-binding protein